MRYSIAQYAQALYEAIQETATKDHDKVIDNFTKTLQENGDLSAYEKIVAAYETYDREQQGIKQVEITTARDLEVNVPMLKQLNAIVGTDIEVKRRVDERLIGGVVIKVDDTLIDGSIKTQLDKLNQTLSH